MSWEEYEALIYSDVARNKKRGVIVDAVGDCVRDMCLGWYGWPGLMTIANHVMRRIEESEEWK